MKPPVRHPTQTEDVYEALVERYCYKDKTGEEAIWLWERDQRIAEAKENIRLKPELKIVQMDNNVFYKEVEYEKEYVKTPDGYFELHMKAKPLGPAMVLFDQYEKNQWELNRNEAIVKDEITLQHELEIEAIETRAKEIDRMASEVLSQTVPETEKKSFWPWVKVTLWSVLMMGSFVGLFVDVFHLLLNFRFPWDSPFGLIFVLIQLIIFRFSKNCLEQAIKDV